MKILSDIWKKIVQIDGEVDKVCLKAEKFCFKGRTMDEALDHLADKVIPGLATDVSKSMRDIPSSVAAISESVRDIPASVAATVLRRHLDKLDEQIPTEEVGSKDEESVQGE